MPVFKCKMCGGTLEISENQTIATCEYCGTQQTLPKANDEIIANLFNRANNLRLKNEFDKAQEIYEKIINGGSTDPEAYWGVVLCKYGIEYVEDPATYKRVPTCHRTQLESVLTDVDFIAAIEHADDSRKTIYQSEAAEIDRLQKNILQIVHKEKPFDVFICYKETDENGKRTVDSVIANDIYYQLTQEGFKVFYAAITLEDKLGQEYEPYIFVALNSAKVMLVIGTKPEYFDAVWVRNEWSRFLKIIRNDRSKSLIPCYKDMDAYDLPEEFSHLQAQDMGKIGFINDIVRGIRKLIPSTTAETTMSKQETVVVNGGNTDAEPLLKRAYLFLEDGDFASADEYFEKVLDLDPENAKAYVGKMLVELKCKKESALSDRWDRIDGNSNYQKALRFADQKYREILFGYNNGILEKLYQQAMGNKEKAQSDKDYQSIAAFLRNKLAGYKDAEEQAKACDRLAADWRLEQQYQQYLQVESNLLSDTGVEEADWKSMADRFVELGDYKDARARAAECRARAETVRQEQEYQAQKHAEEERKAKIKRKKKIKKVLAIGTPIVAVCVAFVILLNTVIIPNVKYNQAMKCISAGEYEEGYDILTALGGHSEEINDSKYERALAHMEKGGFAEAVELFEDLENYKDSKDKVKEAMYAQAEKYLQDKNYEQAYEAFYKAGDFKDSGDRAKEASYLNAQECMEAKDYTKAYESFYKASDYKDAKQRLKDFLVVPSKKVSISSSDEKRTRDYTYDKNGNLTKETFYNFLNDYTSIHEYSYDNNGNMIKKVDDYTITEYTYNKNGNLIKVKSGDGFTTEYSYDTNGNRIKAVRTETIGSDYVINKFVIEYSYDSNGNCIKEVRTDDDGQKSTYKYTYDENGNLIKNDSGSGSTTNYEYSYDKNGILVRKVIDEAYTDYTYDDSGNLIKEVFTNQDVKSSTEYSDYQVFYRPGKDNTELLDRILVDMSSDAF